MTERNSGGLILYIRNTYVSNDTLVYTSMDNIIWVKIDKSLLSLSSDLYIALCYVTSVDSSRQSMLETNVFDRLLDTVSFIENKTCNCCNLLVCGDFNSLGRRDI